MRFVPAFAAVLLAACATAPKGEPVAAVPAAEPAPLAPARLKPIPGPVAVEEVPYSAVATELELTTPGTGEVVELRFGWPAGGAAELHYVASRTRTFEGVPSTVQLARGVLSLEAEGVPAERPVRLAIRTATRSSETEGNERELPGFLLNLAVALPLDTRWTVDADGVLQELPTPPDPTELIDRMLRARNLTMEAGLREMVRQTITPATLQARAAEFWMSNVGAWSGGKVELGAVYRIRTSETQPNGVVYTSTTELTAAARVPCAEGEVEPRCVRLELRMTPDPVAEAAMFAPMRESLRQVLERDGLSRELMEGIHTTDEVVLIAEPAGLFPRRWEHRRRQTMTYRGPVPRGLPTGTLDERVVDFAWTAR